MDDWQQTIGTRKELLETIHRLREQLEAAEQAGEALMEVAERDKAKLARVREWAESHRSQSGYGTAADDVLALLDGEDE